MKPLFLWLMLAATAAAQYAGTIAVPAQNEPYSPIVATYEAAEIPNGADVQATWKASEGVSWREPTPGTVYIWAPPGVHEITVELDWIVIDWEAKTFRRGRPKLIGQFRVGEPEPVVVVDPDDPPIPEDPPDPTTPAARRWVIVIRDQEQATDTKLIGLQVQINRHNLDNPGDQITLKQATRDGIQADGVTSPNLATWGRKVPPEAEQPYVFALTSQVGQPNVIHGDDEFVDAEEVLGWFADKPPPSEITRLAYVYEQRSGPVPVGVMAAIKEIASAGEIEAVTEEADAVNVEWKAAREAAADEGLPALVLMNEDGVVRVVKVDDYESVMEAVK